MQEEEELQVKLGCSEPMLDAARQKAHGGPRTTSSTTVYIIYITKSKQYFKANLYSSIFHIRQNYRKW